MTSPPKRRMDLSGMFLTIIVVSALFVMIMSLSPLGKEVDAIRQNESIEEYIREIEEERAAKADAKAAATKVAEAEKLKAEVMKVTKELRAKIEKDSSYIFCIKRLRLDSDRCLVDGAERLLAPMSIAGAYHACVKKEGFGPDWCLNHTEWCVEAKLNGEECIGNMNELLNATENEALRIATLYGAGGIPVSLKDRIALYVTPPTAYVGGLPEGVSTEDFKYISHSCKPHTSNYDGVKEPGVVCSACYLHDNDSFQVNFTCPNKDKGECSILWFDDNMLIRKFKINPSSCKRA